MFCVQVFHLKANVQGTWETVLKCVWGGSRVGALLSHKGRVEGFCPGGPHWGICRPGSYQVSRTQQQVSQPLSRILPTPHCCLLSLRSKAAGRAHPAIAGSFSPGLVPLQTTQARAVVLGERLITQQSYVPRCRNGPKGQTGAVSAQRQDREDFCRATMLEQRDGGWSAAGNEQERQQHRAA